MINKKRLIITSSISIILVSILFLGTTYSIFTTSDIDEDLNVYKTGDLNIEYTSNNVKITDVTPMTEEEADAVIPHRITVTNDGNVPYMFDVILTDTTSSETNTIDYQYIMTKVGYLTPKKLSNCPNNIIKEDVILPAGESVDIDVRVWLSDNLSNSEIGKSFYSKLSIDGLAIYNDNKDIDNSILSLKYMKELFPYEYSDFFNEEDETTDFTIRDYFKNETYNSYIKTASFVDYIDTTNAVEYWDVSEKEDSSVVAWVEANEEEGYYNLYIGAKYKIYAESLNMFFFNSSSDLEGMDSLKTINLDNLDTSLTKNMSYLFGQLYYLEEVDVNNLDTSNVTNMEYMFEDCESLIELDLSNFDTHNITNMRYMFGDCLKLTKLDLSNFDTSKVTDMSQMFYVCRSLTELDVSNFDTSNVTNMTGMFQSCKLLTELDITHFDTSKVTNMIAMFSGCKSLEILDLSNFDTSAIIGMYGMFTGCQSLKTLDLSNFDTSKVTNTWWLFYGCSNLTTTITIKNALVTDYGSMFQDAATEEGAQITVNYTADTATLVDNMIATKSDNSNVVKGQLIA